MTRGLGWAGLALVAGGGSRWWRQETNGSGGPPEALRAGPSPPFFIKIKNFRKLTPGSLELASGSRKLAPGSP